MMFSCTIVSREEHMRHPDIVHMTLFLTCGVLFQTVTRIEAAEKTRAWVEFRNVTSTSCTQVVPVGTH